MRASLGKVVLVLLGILLPFLLLELCVRALPLALLPAPLTLLLEEMDLGARRHYREHKELKHTIKPDLDFIFKHPEFIFRYKTNLNFPDAGFRGGSLGGPVWGVTLGDSFTFGAGVDQEATWSGRLAALVKQDVINLGVPGYGPIQYTRALEKYGLPLAPKIVFYALFTNDLNDSLRFNQWLNGREKKMSIRKYLRQNSIAYHLVGKLTGSRERSSRYVEVPEVGIRLMPRKLRDPYDLEKVEFDAAWPLTARQIDQANEDCKKINATLVVLYFPSKEEVYWDRIRATASRFSSFEDQRDRMRKSVREFCAGRQLFCLDLSPSLRARGASGEKLYFPIDSHWNETGHRVVAETIQKFLIDSRIL